METWQFDKFVDKMFNKKRRKNLFIFGVLLIISDSVTWKDQYLVT